MRFEGAFAALAPDLHVIAPWREWDLRSREACLDYLAERNIPCAASLTKIYSRDANAWHVSTEGGVLESTWNAPNEDCWVWTVDPEQAPNEAEYVTLQVAHGEVVAVDGEAMTPYNAWCRSYRHRGKPFGGYEISRLLRNPGRHHHHGSAARG